MCILIELNIHFDVYSHEMDQVKEGMEEMKDFGQSRPYIFNLRKHLLNITFFFQFDVALMWYLFFLLILKPQQFEVNEENASNGYEGKMRLRKIRAEKNRR